VIVMGKDSRSPARLVLGGLCALLVSAGFLFGISIASSQAQENRPPARRKPNVLFIAVDDLNVRLGCYGFDVKTPNIDALAAQSVRFERAYCQYPLCNPSRSSLLTGRYPERTRVMDNRQWFRLNMPEVTTLPGLFRVRGYVTSRVGKIFHAGLDDDQGWDEGGEPYNLPAPRTPEQQAQRERNADRWEGAAGDGENLADARTASRAIAFLEQPREKPFFLAVGFVKPHVPFVAPKKYFDLYDPARITLPPDFAPKPVAGGPDLPPPALRPNFDLFIRREATEAQAREATVAYYAATSFMDAQVGRVLAALDRLGLRDNTIIIFFGDHGFHLGEKGMWSKQSLFEASTRVPLLIAAPMVAQAFQPAQDRQANPPPAAALQPANAPATGLLRTCGRTVELLDLYPTLAELCALPVPAGLAGKSLVPLLKDPSAAWDRPARTVLRRGQVLGRSLRTERYRYTEWNGGRQGVELYDHESDPHEQSNLARDPKLAKTVAELKRLLDAR
jgi:uncharacterized sulfatase